ncbi:probable ATP-dependent RNA helicase DDX49 [Bolinopsis microptera]|uniref:probable ATP-dependent RNA helicase DDX49 n=1 Tax=Bolinopsis microptera TaxID=2820187 RepID=UPI0030793319
MLVPELMRNTALAHTLQTRVGEETCIVFTHSCKSAQILTIGLKKLGFPCTALHSQMNQNLRLSSLAKFKCGVVKILVATDVASRGLDIPTVSYVVNYNTPSAPTDYIHRVGRTARAGAGGCAVTIITQYDIERLQAIEAAIGTQLEETTMSDEESVKILQPVSLAMREALLHLDTHDFGENKARNKRKSDKNGANSPEPLKKRKKNKKMDENSNRGSKQKRTEFNSLSNLKSNKVKPDAIARTGSSKI